MRCFKCDLCASRTQIVEGYGNIDSKVMIIGEAPGYHEDKKGVPFIGASGQYLRAKLKDRGFDNDHFFITNVVKCRPLANATPSAIQIASCKEYLINEMKIVKPKLILTLGRSAIGFILPQLSVAKARLKPITIGNITIIATYHPSYVIQNIEQEDAFLADLDRFLHYYRKLIDFTH